MLPRSLLRSAFCLACLLLTLTLAAPVEAGIVNVKPTFINSTSFVFSVDLIAPLADKLKLTINPESGEPTVTAFDVLASPMEIAVRGLKPDFGYTFHFSMEGTPAAPEGSRFSLDTLRTFRVGPQIVGFVASDLEGPDTVFSSGDQLSIVFDMATNQPAVGNKDEVDQLLQFNQPIGEDYVGTWTDPKVLVITIIDPGQGDPSLGFLTATVIGTIHAPDGKSDVSDSKSPPLIGSFGTRAGVVDYLLPVSGGQVVDNAPHQYFHLTTPVNTNALLPVALRFPAGARPGGYMVSATIVYPRDVAQLGFLLNGVNFQLAPSANIGTDDSLTNEQLAGSVPTITFTPKPNYVGYSSVRVQLFDIAGGYNLVSSAYFNVKVEGPAKTYTPEFSARSTAGSTSTNPIDFAKTHKTSLIIGLCVTFGFFLLLGLSICAWRKYRGGRDARDFESSSLTMTEEPTEAPEAAGPTRRFYYDAKV